MIFKNLYFNFILKVINNELDVGTIFELDYILKIKWHLLKKKKNE